MTRGIRGTEDIANFDDVSPERRLIAAILRQATTDARGRYGEQARAAQDWLRHRAIVEWWIDLAGFPDTTYARLLARAGMEAPP
jgi:hypothetical protein